MSATEFAGKDLHLKCSRSRNDTNQQIGSLIMGHVGEKAVLLNGATLRKQFERSNRDIETFLMNPTMQSYFPRLTSGLSVLFYFIQKNKFDVRSIVGCIKRV